MQSYLSHRLFYFVLSITFFLVFISCFFIPIIIYSNNSSVTFSYSVPSNYSSFNLNDSSFLWPCPGYTNITSPFGKRKSPTKGASTYHSGIDIGVPTGTPLLAITNGKITMAKFSGAGGCTITLKNNDYSISYCHVSPNYIVSPGDIVKKGQVIAHVGPKNIYGISNNPYKDSNGRPTNGATTGAHLHLTIRKKDELVNPISLFK